MGNMSGDWGHNDWNENGEYDSYDNMRDYEYEQEFYGGGGGSSGGGGRGSENINAMLVKLGIGIVLGIFNELLGAIFLFFWLWYEIFFK